MLYRVFGSKDLSSDASKLNRSASKWTKTDLRLPGADYQYDIFDDIRIGIDDADVPHELLESNNLLATDEFLVIEGYAQRIETVNMNVLKGPGSDPEILEMLCDFNLEGFDSTCLSLATLLPQLRRSTRSQIAFVTPPRQTTVPEDPFHSGGSTSSGSSTESKPEPYAQNVATNFLTATYSTVAKWMRRFI